MHAASAGFDDSVRRQVDHGRILQQQVAEIVVEDDVGDDEPHRDTKGLHGQDDGHCLRHLTQRHEVLHRHVGLFGCCVSVRTFYELGGEGGGVLRCCFQTRCPRRTRSDSRSIEP